MGIYKWHIIYIGLLWASITGDVVAQRVAQRVVSFNYFQTEEEGAQVFEGSVEVSLIQTRPGGPNYNFSQVQNPIILDVEGSEAGEILVQFENIKFARTKHRNNQLVVRASSLSRQGSLDLPNQDLSISGRDTSPKQLAFPITKHGTGRWTIYFEIVSSDGRISQRAGRISIGQYKIRFPYSAWNEAKALNTCEVIEAFLQEYPESQYQAQANALKDRLCSSAPLQDQEWQRCLGNPSKECLEKFLESSTYSLAALSELSKLDEVAWDKASTNNLCSEYQAYLKEWNQGEYKGFYVPEAELRISTNSCLDSIRNSNFFEPLKMEDLSFSFRGDCMVEGLQFKVQGGKPPYFLDFFKRGEEKANLRYQLRTDSYGVIIKGPNNSISWRLIERLKNELKYFFTQEKSLIELLLVDENNESASMFIPLSPGDYNIRLTDSREAEFILLENDRKILRIPPYSHSSISFIWWYIIFGLSLILSIYLIKALWPKLSLITIPKKIPIVFEKAFLIQKGTIIRYILFSTTAILLFVLFWFGMKKIGPTPPPTPTKYKYGFDLSPFQIQKDLVQEGQSIVDIMSAYQVPGSSISTILELAEPVLDIQSMENKSLLTILSSPTDSIPDIFIYEPSPFEYTVFDLRENMRVYRTERTMEIGQSTASGIIDSALLGTVLNQNLPYDLIGKMEEALQWSVDFYHLNPGDRFKLVYETVYADGEAVGIRDLKAIYFQTQTAAFEAYYYQNGQVEGFFDGQGRSLKRAFLQSPIKYSRISSAFNLNRNHPVLQTVKPHLGTDYAAPEGTPIIAMANGTITIAALTSNNGNYVKIRHDQTYETQYLHMSKFAPGIKPGVNVEQGDVIGFVGSTGLASGPHVCLRFWKNGEQVDHRAESFPVSSLLPEDQLEQFLKTKDQLEATLADIDFR